LQFFHEASSISDIQCINVKKVKTSLICIALYYELLISKALRYTARVNDGSIAVLTATHTSNPQVQQALPAFAPSRTASSPFGGTHFQSR